MGLGLSPAMVARIIAAGTLEVVREDVVGGGPSAGPSLQSPSYDDRSEGSPELAGEWFTTGIADIVRASLAPLVAELAASRQTIERQAERVAGLERENGQLTAALDAARRGTLTAPTGLMAAGDAPQPAVSRSRLSACSTPASVAISPSFPS